MKAQSRLHSVSSGYANTVNTIQASFSEASLNLIKP